MQSAFVVFVVSLTAVEEKKLEGTASKKERRSR
jgi:hypothetical protein